jgi:hypothetical protein
MPVGKPCVANNGRPSSTTAATRAKMLTLWLQGWTADRIAERFGITKGVVSGIRHREQWPARPLAPKAAAPAPAGPKPQQNRPVDKRLPRNIPKVTLPSVTPSSPEMTMRSDTRRHADIPKATLPPVVSVQPVPVQAASASAPAAVSAPAPKPEPVVAEPEVYAPDLIVAPPALPAELLPVVRSISSGPIHRVRTCQWPLGDPRDRTFRFCGSAEVIDGRPYCPEHEARAWHRKARAA